MQKWQGCIYDYKIKLDKKYFAHYISSLINKKSSSFPDSCKLASLMMLLLADVNQLSQLKLHLIACQFVCHCGGRNATTYICTYKHSLHWLYNYQHYEYFSYFNGLFTFLLHSVCAPFKHTLFESFSIVFNCSFVRSV